MNIPERLAASCARASTTRRDCRHMDRPVAHEAGMPVTACAAPHRDGDAKA